MATQTRGTCWSVTINNPTKSDDEQIALARQKSGWKVYGQREKGAQGTEHYQLMITTPQVRFAAVKKAFPRAHIELARDRTALVKYVQKKDTKVADLPTSQDAYPSHSKLMAMFGEYFTMYSEENGGVDDSQFLKIFDQMCYQKIKEGYYVETYAVNPQIRSAIQKFGRAIARREFERRQTDRQTADIIVAVNDITNGEGSEGSEKDDEETAEEDESSSITTG